MTKGTVGSVTRRLPRQYKVPLRSYATVVGEIVWASNYLYGAFEILFSHVATPGNFLMGRGIWQSASSERAKLDMLEAAVETSESLASPMQDRIIWTIGCARKLAELRNDAVHSATIVVSKNGSPMLVPSDIGTKQKRSDRLRAEPDLKKKYRVVKGDLLQLGQYVFAIWPHVAGFEHLPRLPARPRFQSIPKAKPRKP